MTARPRISIPNRLRKMPRLPAWLVICGLVFAATLALWQTGHFQFLELQAYDYFLRSQPRSTKEADQVAIVGISEDDIRQLHTYPVPVDALADALEAILAQQPAAVVVDLYRDLPIPGTKPADDARLVRCFRDHPNLLAIRRLGIGNSPDVPAPPFLSPDSEQAGFNDFSVDYQVDETARRVLISMDDGETLHFSVSLLASMLYLQTRHIQLVQDPVNPAHFQLGRATLLPFEANDGAYVNADARGHQALLDFRGPAQFVTFNFIAARTGQIPPESLRGKVVFIGLMANSVNDHITTPLAKRYPGVMLHAQVVNQLLRYALDGDTPIRFWPRSGATLWLLAWCAAGTAIGLAVRSPWLFVGLVVAGMSALFGAFWLSLSAGLWLLVVAPAAGFGAAAALGTSHQAYVEKRQRDTLMQLFSRHVSPNVATDIWRQREHFMEGHRPKSQVIVSSVFFSDLRGFTKMAETLSPEALLSWLNEYMEMMASLIEEHDGLVIKYMGDAIMAAFGAPLPRTSEAEIRRDAENAVRCALLMAGRLDELNHAWQQRGLPTTTMRIGIATGPMVSGSIGGSRRLEYTVTGDTVVTAKRLESVHKDAADLERASQSCRVLISEATAEKLGPQFRMRRTGAMQLEGKQEAVVAFVVFGESAAEKS